MSYANIEISTQERTKKLKLLIWTWIKINTKHRFFSSLAKIRSHYTLLKTLVSCSQLEASTQVSWSLSANQRPVSCSQSQSYSMRNFQQLECCSRSSPLMLQLLQLAHICEQLHSFCNVCPHPRAQEQIKSRQKATLRSQCFANRAQSAIIRTLLLLYRTRRPATAGPRLGAPHHKKYQPGFCTKWDEKAVLGPCPVFTQRIMWPWRVKLQ